MCGDATLHTRFCDRVAFCDAIIFGCGKFECGSKTDNRPMTVQTAFCRQTTDASASLSSVVCRRGVVVVIVKVSGSHKWRQMSTTSSSSSSSSANKQQPFGLNSSDALRVCIRPLWRLHLNRNTTPVCCGCYDAPSQRSCRSFGRSELTETVWLSCQIEVGFGVAWMVMDSSTSLR